MISENLVDSIKRHEGFSAKVYRCSAGVPIIGWGRALEDPGTGITEEEADCCSRTTSSASKQ
jgi:GH24 family phage-related lysozyme (muramidase)